MPAEIDTMFYAGETPWHRLGTRLDRPATAQQAIVAAGLDWEVQLQPIYTGVNRDVKIKDRYVVCRHDRLEQKDGGQLAVVGRDYTPLQNREAFGFLDPVVGQGGAVYHTAGALRGGRRVWMLAKLPGEIRVVGDDVAKKFILLSSSHDGTAAVRIGFTPIRVVCQNTLNLALRGMQGLSIRHNPDVADRVKQAHQLLGIVGQTFDRAQEIMQGMARTPIAGSRLRGFYEQVLPIAQDADELTRERVRQRYDRWTELFESGDGNRMPGVGGTLWAAYNGVTQWADRESYTSRNREPLNSIWFGEGERIKRRAFDVAGAWAGAGLN